MVIRNSMLVTAVVVAGGALLVGCQSSRETARGPETDRPVRLTNVPPHPQENISDSATNVQDIQRFNLGSGDSTTGNGANIDQSW